MKQNSFLLAAGVSLAMAFTFSCSSDGSDGKDGTNGAQGLPGEQGTPGIQGNAGEGCSMKSITEGIEITCGSQVDTLKNGSNGTNGIDGEDGKSCEAEQNDDGIITITCGESTVGIAFCSDENKFYNPVSQSCYNDKVYYFFTDSRDDKKYVYVEMGDYIWMAEYLTYEKADGKYTWEEALTACPSGWELPTLSVIQALIGMDMSVLNSDLNSFSWSVTESEDDDEDAYVMQTGSPANPISSIVSTRHKITSGFVRCVKAN